MKTIDMMSNVIERSTRATYLTPTCITLGGERSVMHIMVEQDNASAALKVLYGQIAAATSGPSAYTEATSQR